MNAARKLPSLEQTLVQSEGAPSKAAQTVSDVMTAAAKSRSIHELDQHMRFYGSDLVEALTELASSAKEPTSENESLEERLRSRQVSEVVLDNLELSQLHFRRGQRLFEHLSRNFGEQELSSEAQSRMQECWRAQWEVFFGLTYIGFIADGRIPTDAPGTEPLLCWMRRSARNVYVHACAADNASHKAA